MPAAPMKRPWPRRQSFDNNATIVSYQKVLLSNREDFFCKTYLSCAGKSGSKYNGDQIPAVFQANILNLVCSKFN